MPFFTRGLAEVGAKVVGIGDSTRAALPPMARESLSLYLQVLGHRWFSEPHQHMVDELLLHEFAHHQVSDHLSERFHDECCRLGDRPQVREGDGMMIFACLVHGQHPLAVGACRFEPRSDRVA